MLINIVIWIWNYTGCIIIREVMLPLLRGITALIAGIISFFRADAGIVKFLYTIIHYMEKITCDFQINCNFETDPTSRVEFGALPVASRCWADFSPEVDAADSFSCTRSDTCRVSNLEYGTTIDEYGSLKEDGNQIVCDACPLQPGGLVNSFGCDTYTKQCTCNRPKLERTYCTSNQECTLQGAASASCALVGDFSTGTSYGTMPCNLCPSSQPICLTIKDQTKGICTCLQSGEPVLQSCRNVDVQDRVFPDASQLCAITLDARRVSTQTAASIDWNSLAAAPCVLISPSNAYCYNVPGTCNETFSHTLSGIKN